MNTYAFTHHDHHVLIDRSRQVIEIEVAEDQGGLFELRSALASRSRDESEKSDDINVIEAGSPVQAPAMKDVASALDRFDLMLPGMAVSQKAKAYDDRLFAALELLVHEGLPRRRGKRRVVADLQSALPAGSPNEARGLLAAALHLRGEPLPQGKAALYARRILAKSRQDRNLSEPVGIYTRSEELATVFRCDRVLQMEIESDTANAYRWALESRPELANDYQWHVEFAKTLTGKLAYPPVTDDGDGRRLFPPSDSPEAQIIKALFNGPSVPDGFNLADEVVARVRRGDLSLEPREGDGLYVRQLYAAAALLTPDAPGLLAGPRYQAELEDRFKALFALTRETHIKQLQVLAAGGIPPLRVSPSLTLEPLPQYYQRLADAYDWLRVRLTELLGEATMHRPLLSREQSVADTLVEMWAICRGAALTAWSELGKGSASSDPRDDLARASFRSWTANKANDADLKVDLRCVVPLYFDLDRRKVHVQVILGVQRREVEVRFVDNPDVQVFDASGLPVAAPTMEWASDKAAILSPVSLECEVERCPPREEFRRLCDEHQTPEAIKSALERLS